MFKNLKKKRVSYVLVYVVKYVNYESDDDQDLKALRRFDVFDGARGPTLEEHVKVSGS